MIRTEAELLRWLRDNVADLLEIDANEIDPERPLTELGISSRDAVGLVGELEDFLDRDLDATLVWQTPTIAALAAALAGEGSTAPSADAAQGATPADAAEIPAPGGGDVAAVGAPEVPPSVAAGDDPMVIVGLGCRLPGESAGPTAFWDLLTNGRDAVTEVPAGRWDDFTAPSSGAQEAAARTNRSGGYLGDVSRFDAEFFGITPREAELMDPQQRMLLEVTIEALEHAGTSVESLRGSDTGVFVGMSTNEYSHLTTADLTNVDAWTATGSAFSIAANRLSYLFDLRGPSMTLDTACSSSLVAIHQARLSMAAGEIDTAIVAGVNLLLAPAVTMTFDQAGALAATGGPKPFSSDADGIARAEGCGVVVLKKLSKAQADGDRVLAVVRGSGVNSDGRSNGLTAPNPLAQEALLRSAYAQAGIVPEHVDYIEAHGTGTLLGDPIEAGALGAALGRNRDPEKPLLLGSVKSNLGHLESAAGIAGVIKVVLGLMHDRIPASLKYAGPNPHIRFDDWRLAVVSEERDWPRYGGTALAGVSGFGFGGTNAHVILQEFIEDDETPAATVAPADDASSAANVSPASATVPDDDAVFALPLSGRSEVRVRALAGALAGELASSEIKVRDVAHTLTRRRGRGPFAAVVAARGREALVDALQRLATEQEQPLSHSDLAQTVVAPVPATAPVAQHTPGSTDAVWVFSGWGQQWAGMGRQLLVDEPVFAASIDELEPLIQAEAGFSLRAALEGRVPVEGVAAIQIVLFSIQVSLAALWRSLGLRPAAVIGHSMGEVAASVVAGGLSLADGVRVITVRSRLLEQVEKAGAGAMAVVDLDPAELERLADRFPDVAVCVYGAPAQLTVGSPNAEQLAELCRYVEGLGRNAFPLKVRGAAHSPSIDPVLGDLAAGVEGITPLTPTVRMYSTALADVRSTPAFDVDYWVKNARQPVRFSQATIAAAEDGHAAFIEISAHPVALNSLRQSVGGRVGSGLLALPTLRRDADDTVTFRAHALAAVLAGVRASGDLVVPVAAQVDLPLPVWQHRSHWVESTISQVPDVAVDRHPLLGVHVELPEGGRFLFRADAGTLVLPWLRDHQVYDVPVLPVAAYAEMALAAAREVLAPDGTPSDVVLEDLQLLEMMTLGEHTDVTTSLTLLDGGAAQIDIHARPPGSTSATPMSKHASAVVRRSDSVPASGDLVIDVAAAEEGQPVDLYSVMAAAGHEYGPSFLGVSSARLSDGGVATARVTLPDGVPHHAGYTVHPVLLDICLQTIVVSALSLLDDASDAEGQFYLPVGVGRVRVLGDPGRGGLASASIRAVDGGSELVGGVRVVDDAGNVIVEVADVKLRRIGSDEIAVPLPDLLFSAAWELSELPTGARRASWLLLDATDGDAAPLAASLEEAGHRVVVAHADRLGTLDLRAGLDDDPERPAAGVLLLTPGLPADAGSVGGELGARAAYRLGEVVAQLADDLTGTGLDLVLVTASGAAVLDGEPGRPSLNSLRGQVRVLARVPQAPRISLVDLDGDPLGLARELSATSQDEAQDDEIAWRTGERWVRRLRRAALAELGEPFTLRPGGYVLTDALGETGLRIARGLAARLARAGGSSRLVLGSATASADEADSAVSALAGVGVPVEVLIGDPSDAETVKRLISAATAADLPLRGLIQVPSGAVVDTEEESRVAVAAAWHLHDLSTRSDLDVFCLRSSASTLFGALAEPEDLDALRLDATVGAWIDGLVSWRRAQGLPATSVQWGDLGVLGDGPAADAFALLGPSRPQLGVVRVSAADLASAAAERPYFSELAVPEPEAGEDWPGPEGLRSMAPAAARQKLADRLRARVAWVMGHRPEDIDLAVPLSSLGVDSLVAMRAKNAVEADVGISLPVRLLLQGASLADLEAYLAGELGIDVAPAPTATSPAAAADVEARDGTERWLVSVWEQVTGSVPSGVTAPLSSLGSAAHAVAAADLILARLADEPAAAGQTLPTRESLTSAASIEEQAETVRDLIENVGDSVVRLLAAGERGARPLFVFHPAGGTTSVYYPMVSQLHSSIPVYGFERLDGLANMDAKVDQYLAEIRRIQPEGPYRLGGWSFGGALGYRTAQRLREQGQEIDLLFLIDTILVRPDEQSERDMLAGRFERFIEYLENTYDLDLDIDVQNLVDLPEDEQIATLMRLVQESGANLSPALMEHQRTSYEDARIAEKFQPTVYGDGRVVLYRSTERGLTTSIDPRYARTEDSLGWDVYCNDLEVVRVPGNHTSMIDRPQVDTMAQHLSTALQEVSPRV